jgi:hypothetical protein
MYFINGRFLQTLHVNGNKVDKLMVRNLSEKGKEIMEETKQIEVLSSTMAEVLQ